MGHWIDVSVGAESRISASVSVRVLVCFFHERLVLQGAKGGGKPSIKTAPIFHTKTDGTTHVSG